MNDSPQDKACPCLEQPPERERTEIADGNGGAGPSVLAVPTPPSSRAEGLEPPLTKPASKHPAGGDAQQTVPSSTQQPNAMQPSAVPPSAAARVVNDKAPFESMPPDNDNGGGGGSSSRDLLDLLMDVCAAPPPYPLGSGVATLGHDACKVAMHTFGLLSASLFEVVGSSPAMAVRVAAVQAGGGDTIDSARREGSAAGVGAGHSQSESAAAAAAAAVAEFELPERERLGDGTVGVAAQSARPVCIEVVCPSSGAGFVGGRGATTTTAAAKAATMDFSPSSRFAGMTSTVLCLPVMLQSVPLPRAAPTGFVGGDGTGIQGGPTIPSVEVVGVLRAARAGTGAFAGDDARALSAFCGQLALAMVADRALAAGELRREKEAVREARAFRRKACRKVATLFAEGAVAGALLRHAGVGREASSSSSPPSLGVGAGAATSAVCARRGTKEGLWGSVAGLAAQALGCERVDLLRLTSLSDAGGGAGGVAGFLSSQRPPSRSFRRRSREALLAARASSSSVSSSQGVPSSSNGGEGGGGSETRDAIGSWLCIPVLGPGEESTGQGDGSIGGGGGGGGAATVCCAVNKRNGRNFDDVDEVRELLAWKTCLSSYRRCL